VTGGTLVTSANPVPGVSGAPLVVSGLAPTYSPGAVPQGTLLCPIIEAGMKLTRGCQLGNPQPDRASGKATYLGVAKGDPCPDGFRDDGDYCAKPEAYGRGAGYAWQFGDAAFDSSGQWSRCRAANSQGCEQPGGGITLVYPLCKSGFHAVGTNICSPNCPSSWEDIGVSCKKPNNMGNCKAYGRVAGLGYAFHDPRNGGECWACPVLMHRTMSPVTSTDSQLPACTAGNDDGIIWISAQYPESGLAAFVGNGDIVRLALSDRAYVDAYLNKRAASTQTTKQQLWDKMINTPNDSPELKALVFAAMMTVAQADPNLTSNAGYAVSMFQSYVQKRRTYVAQDATAMYHAYEGFNAYKQWKGAQATMAAGGPLGFMSAGTGAIIMSPSGGLGSTVGVPPDDYVNAAQAAAVPDARGQAFIKALNDLATTPYANPSLGTTVTNPVSGMQLGLNIANSSKAFYDMLTGMRVASEISALGGRVGAGLDLGMSLGGSVLDAIGAVMTVFAQQEAAAQYASLVTEASKPVNIRTILTSGSDDDKNSLIAWWALATSGYQAGPTEGQNPTTDAQICGAYPTQCSAIKQIATASRT
jgi:hypothetical protein